MPKMYKTGDIRHFDTLEKGLSAGYYPSFSALATACREAKYGKPEQAPVTFTTAEPKATDGMSIDDLRAYAVKHGLDPEAHHKTLRKAVEVHLEQVGTDQERLRADSD